MPPARQLPVWPRRRPCQRVTRALASLFVCVHARVRCFGRACDRTDPRSGPTRRPQVCGLDPSLSAQPAALTTYADPRGTRPLITTLPFLGVSISGPGPRPSWRRGLSLLHASGPGSPEPRAYQAMPSAQQPRRRPCQRVTGPDTGGMRARASARASRRRAWAPGWQHTGSPSQVTFC
jgi:hypothetical protein